MRREAPGKRDKRACSAPNRTGLHIHKTFCFLFSAGRALPTRLLLHSHSSFARRRRQHFYILRRRVARGFGVWNTIVLVLVLVRRSPFTSATECKTGVLARCFDGAPHTPPRISQPAKGETTGEDARPTMWRPLPHGARRSTTSFIPFAVRRAPAENAKLRTRNSKLRTPNPELHPPLPPLFIPL